LGCCYGSGAKTNQPSKNDPASGALEAVAERFANFCNRVTSLFRTTTGNGSEHARVYLHGLMQARSRAKNMERMEEAVAGADYEGLQHFIADSPWQAQPVMDHVALEVSGLLDGPQCLAYVDETCTSKKGTKSVGVARQYNGRLGKVDNCQVAVFAALGRGERVALVGTRLYLPQQWCEDPARCQAAGVPVEDRVFKTKSTLALELITHLRGIGAKFAATVLDAGYGKEPAFLRSLDAAGEVFVVDVHSSQGFWREDPWPAARLPGATRRASSALHAVGTALSVSAWVDAEGPEAWRTVVLRQGTKGEIRVEFIHQRVYLWDGEEASAKLWHLVARRTLDAQGRAEKISWTLSNAPADTPATQIVAMACARYFIERSFQDAKTSLGLADYQTRGWLAWHHHMALVMLAMLFQLCERLMHEQEYPLLSAADIIELLRHYLPAAATTREDVLEQLRQRHRKRKNSIDSARRKQRPRENFHELLDDLPK
jgi:SRSO17 transposase